MDQQWKCDAQRRESMLVRPVPLGNAICQATDPDLAIWIAQRLNHAARFEEANRERFVKWYTEEKRDWYVTEAAAWEVWQAAIELN